jgi:ectoine hydroxylase-related dioxygenase (phytanoyl-CoA dioxygenase family)
MKLSLVNNYLKNGFCIFKNFLDTKELNLIKLEINKITRNLNDIKVRKRDLNMVAGKINTMHGLTRYNKFFLLFSKNKKIKRLCEALLTSRAKFREAEYFAKPAKVGMPSPFHQDNYYWNVKKGKALTMWFSIDKSNKSNGGLGYLCGSQKLGTIPHEPSYAPGSSQKIPDKKIIYLKKKFKIYYPNLNPGDVLIHSSEVIHGSNANKSNNSRRGITMQFQDFYAEIDKVKYNKYLKKLYNQISLRQKNKERILKIDNARI